MTHGILARYHVYCLDTVISERKRQNLIMKSSFHKPDKVEDGGISMKNGKNTKYFQEEVFSEQDGANSEEIFDTRYKILLDNKE